MLTRMMTTASIWALVMVATTGAALAQRPPPSGEGSTQLSIERAWNWLIARPGVIIALLIIVVAIGYMIVTRSKSRA